jgi:hypothetical protein
MSLSGAEFNSAAERYYRDTLRKQHLEEALELLQKNIAAILLADVSCGNDSVAILRSIFGNVDPVMFVRSVKSDLVEGCASEDTIIKTVQLSLLSIYYDRKENATALQENTDDEKISASVY